MRHNRLTASQDEAAPAEPAADTPDQPTLPDTALVPVAARHDGWTPARQRAFIETLADTACVKAAAAAAGMTPQSAWRLRRRADARAFDAAWEGALAQGLSRLVSVAIDRAINGTMRERYYHGELIAQERVHHDSLLLALIRRGEGMLDHGRKRRAMLSNWDGAMAALEAGASDPAALASEPYAVWDLGGMLVTNCPPGPGHEGFKHGTPYSDGYMRALTVDEMVGRLVKQGRDPADEEDKRRAMFGLERLYTPSRPRTRAAARAAAARAGATAGARPQPRAKSGKSR